MKLPRDMDAAELIKALGRRMPRPPARKCTLTPVFSGRNVPLQSWALTHR